MPLHDWTRVDAGTFHHFHSIWITHLSEWLNGGALPEGYYALAEQHAGLMVGDVLRHVIAGSIILGIGLILGYRPEAGLPGVIAAFLLLIAIGFGMGWIFMVLGLLIRTPTAVMTLGFGLLFPLVFASNTMVDPATMPVTRSANAAIDKVRPQHAEVADMLAAVSAAPPKPPVRRLADHIPRIASWISS